MFALSILPCFKNRSRFKTKTKQCIKLYLKFMFSKHYDIIYIPYPLILILVRKTPNFCNKVINYTFWAKHCLSFMTHYFMICNGMSNNQKLNVRHLVVWFVLLFCIRIYSSIYSMHAFPIFFSIIYLWMTKKVYRAN